MAVLESFKCFRSSTAGLFARWPGLKLQSDLKSNRVSNPSPGHQTAVTSAHSNKRYIFYFALSFGLLVLTAVILLFDIRRKSRSGKADDGLP